MTQATSSEHATIFLGEDDSAPSVVADYAQLTKPRITLMVVITAAIGYAFGIPAEGWQWGNLLAMLAGVALSCMGAAAFNQVVERDTDALMTRTANRPLPAGRLTLRGALVAGLLLSAAGVAVLALGCNALSAAISAFTIVSYAAMYTPMKRMSTLALEVGAIPGALPPVIGFAAASNTLGEPAWVLFAIMYVWQLPHFQAIAWLYREDYARAGMAMLPVVDPTGRRTFRQILVTTMLLVPLGIVPTAMGISGMVAYFVAMVCGLLFLAMAVALVLEPSRAAARRLFLASLVYLPVVLGAMVLDRP